MTRPPSFDLVLDQALEALAAGHSPAEIAARYAAPIYPPRFAADLLPLLEAARLANSGLSAPVPAPDLARGRRRFLAAAAVPAARPRPKWAIAFAIVAVVLGLLFVAPSVSAAALPGDVLYPLKRAVEGVQLALTLAPAERQDLAERLADQRRQEAARLLALRREARLAFEGRVEASAPERLTISGLTVQSADARAFHPGDLVAVEARTTRTGSLIATRLTLLDAAPPGREATPIATPERPRATPTRPRPTPTMRATDATRATPTDISTAAVTRPASSPTVAATRPAPTSTPPPPTRPVTDTPTPIATQRPIEPSATAQRPTEARPTETQRARP